MTAVTLFSPHFQQDSVALFQKMSNNFINNVLDNEHLNYLIRNHSFGLKAKTRPELHYRVNNMASKFEFALKVKHEKIQTHTTNGFSGSKNIGQTLLGVAIRPVQTQWDRSSSSRTDSRQVTVEGGREGGAGAKQRGEAAEERKCCPVQRERPGHVT